MKMKKIKKKHQKKKRRRKGNRNFLNVGNISQKQDRLNAIHAKGRRRRDDNEGGRE